MPGSMGAMVGNVAAENREAFLESGAGVVDLVGGLVLEVLWGAGGRGALVVAGGAGADVVAGTTGGGWVGGTTGAGGSGSAKITTGSGHFAGAGIVNIIGIH